MEKLKQPAHSAKSKSYSREDVARILSKFKKALDDKDNYKRRYMSIFNNKLNCVFVVGLDGKVMDINQTALDLLGYQKDEIKGMHFSSLVVKDQVEHINLAMGKLLERGYPEKTAEITLTAKDGSLLTIASTSSVLSKEGEPYAIQGVANNITESKNLEQENDLLEREYHQVQKLDSLGKLAGGMSHNINNLLCGIMGYTELIKMSNLDQDKKPKNLDLDENLNLILSLSEKMKGLTGKFLAFARQGKYQNVQVDSHVIIHEVVNLMKNSMDSSISINHILDANRPFVMGDPGQIQNAILNIAINARDAMPKGGRITIATKNIELGNSDLVVLQKEAKPGNYLCIEISDTGVGMDSDTKQRVFEPFFTTKAFGESTGLGLSSVYGTVKSHGGEITFSSELGKGTVFRIYLPFVEQKIQKAEESAPAAGRTFGKILLVDDDPIITEVTSEMLDAEGYTVKHISRNGKEGLDYFRDHWNDIDLVILDMKMPVMNGAECLEGMKKVNPNVKVIFASGYSLDEEAESVNKAGAKAFIQKPFRLETLIETVSSVLKD